MKRKSSFEMTKEQRMAMPTVYAVCQTCQGWTMVSADDPNDTKEGKRWVNEAIAAAVRRGDLVKRTTGAGFRALTINMCRCERAKPAESEPAQATLF